MTIKIFDNHLENCGVGISAPADANVEIGRNRFIACGKAVDIREPASLLGALGLKPDTPKEIMVEVLSFIGAGQRTTQEVAEKAKTAGLFEWLSAGADATTLVQGLAALYPHAQKIITQLAA